MDRVTDDELTIVNDLPVTTVARTAFDLGRYQKRFAAIARLDALMRAAPFSADEVSTLMRRYGPVRGVRQLPNSLLVDPGRLRECRCDSLTTRIQYRPDPCHDGASRCLSIMAGAYEAGPSR